MYYKTEGPGGRRHFGWIGTHFRLVIVTMVCLYGVWFWSTGVASGLSQIDDRKECGGLMTFFFGNMNITHWGSRGTQLALAILYATYYGKDVFINSYALVHRTSTDSSLTGVMAIAAIIGVSYYLIRRFQRKEISWELIEQPDSQNALTRRE